jgi:ice-binding like protein
MLRSISVLSLMTRRTVVLPFAVLPALLSFSLLSAGCGDDAEISDDPIASGGTTSTGGSSSAAGGGSAGGRGTDDPSDEQNAGRAGSSGSGVGGARAGAGGEVDDPRDAGALGPAPVQLGDAENFAILAQSAISNVPTSVITGDIGLSPAAASYITGFTLTRAGERWTSPEIVGSAFAADNDPNTPANLTAAVADMATAYEDAAGRPTPGFLNLGDGGIGGRTLVPGLYNWTSTVTIPADVTIAGGAEDVWIFQISGDLTMAAAQRMTLSGGAQAKNIVWQVAGEVDFGATSHAEGIVLSKTAIHLGTGATINGRLLAQTAVSIESTTVTEPAP